MSFANSTTEDSLKCDVLVIGGGPGGVSAAVMAARCGASVILAERYGVLGGMSSVGEVSPFMANAQNHTALDAPLYVDWSRKMWSLLPEHSRLPEFDEDMRDYNTCIISKDISALALEDLCLEAGVEILYGYTFAEACTENESVKSCRFLTKSGFTEISAQCYIDSTGDADVAASAGCICEFGDENGDVQPMSCGFKLSGILPILFPSHEKLTALFHQAQESGEIHCLRSDIQFFLTEDPTVLHFNTTRVGRKNPLNGRELSEATLQCHSQIREYLTFFRKHVPGCANARLHSMAQQIGVRESRRVRGMLYQTVEDFYNRKKYEDAIARVHYQIDIHSAAGKSVKEVHLPENEFYELSFRTLIPLKCRNLLIGCRAISLDHQLHSSSRIMPVVCSIGQAAGMGAAEAVRRNCSPMKLDGIQIRKNLIRQGAKLG